MSMFSSVGHIFSVATTQLCSCSAKAAKQCLSMGVAMFPKKSIYKKKGEGGAIGQVCPTLCCSLT